MGAMLPFNSGIKLISFVFILLYVGCKSTEVKEKELNQEKSVIEKGAEGKLNIQGPASLELRSIKEVITNFSLLNKKKLENEKAYRTLAEIIIDKVEAIKKLSYTGSEEGEHQLKADLDQLNNQAIKLTKGDLKNLKVLFLELEAGWKKVESDFSLNYM